MSAMMWIGLLLVAVVLLVSTANLSIRYLSRVRLAKRLEKDGRLDLLARVMELRNDLLVCTAFLRMSANLALVLIVTGEMLKIMDSDPFSRVFGFSFLASVTVITLFSVVLPTAWARYGGDVFLLFALTPLLAMRVALYPLLALQHLFDGLIRRLAGISSTDEEAEADVIEKEILNAVSEGELAGAVHEEDADMIESVIEFRSTQVAEIMTPRTEMVALPDSSNYEDVRAMIMKEGHSRIPVFGENIDDIKGVLYAKDLLRLETVEGFDILEVMRKVPFIPESKPVAELLEELREKKVHLAIVLDEYGGTAGLVTIEDILEEIVGEIADEYEPSEPEPIRRIAADTIEVDARVHIDELNEELNVALPEDEDYDTVGGFVFSAMGRIPTRGEEFRYSNIKIQVVDAEERKINRLRIQVLSEEAA